MLKVITISYEKIVNDEQDDAVCAGVKGDTVWPVSPGEDHLNQER